MSATSTSLHLPAVPFVYQAGVSQVSLESVKHDSDKYREVRKGPNEASPKAKADEVSCDELPEQE